MGGESGLDLRKVEARAEIEHRRRAVIEEIVRKQDLPLAFQLIAELSSGKVVGVEVLARFHHQPEQAPDVWFAHAAGLGQLTALELTVVRTTLRHQSQWPAGGFVSINFTPETILAPELDVALEDFPIDRLVIELTEHGPVEDYDSIRRALEPLRRRGLRFAVDDAGAGFASLRHILRLDPDIIKLDVSLTAGIHLDAKRRALSAALISFAEEIGATLVAEGIETQVQLDVLRSLGVAYGQGYYLGRPGRLPCSEVVEAVAASANRPAGRPPTTRLRQLTDLIELLNAAIAAGETSSPTHAMKLSLDRICAHTGWPVGHAFLTDEAGKLRSAKVWRLDDRERFQSFRSWSEDQPTQPSRGLLSQALESGRPVWISNIAEAPQYPRTIAAAKAGLCAALAVPITSGSRVLGVLEFLSPDVVVPDQSLMNVLAQFGGQLGRVIERKRTETQLLKQRAQLARAQRIAAIGSWEWDAEKDVVTCSDELIRLLGLDLQNSSLDELLDRIHADDRAAMADAARTAIEKVAAIDFRCRLIRPSGQRLLRGSMEPVVDMSGELLGIVGTVQDVTQWNASVPQISLNS